MERLRTRTAILAAMTLFLASPLASQDAGSTGDQRLQRGFSALELGMTFAAATDALSVDPSFLYRGEPDVQFLPRTDRPIVEVEGRAFIDTAILQFRDDALFVLSLLLDRTRLDYFSVYESLVAQYGPPSALDPGQAIWEDERTRVSLERPLTVKYLDVAIFAALVESGEMEEALDALTRDRFLEGL